jgi:Bacterial archaeo-eukaryotic release factor family 3
MNRALLTELQQRKAYPSITLLLNTTPGPSLSATERAAALRLAEHADRRLDGDVADDVRADLAARVTELIQDQSNTPSAHALAICVSPDYAAAVRLGRPIEERVVIDDTFATRDLVADLNRTALYRVVTVSERKSRLFVGDRTRLAEERTDAWPLMRSDDQSNVVWSGIVAQRLRDEQLQNPLPTVVAGVDRTVRRTAVSDIFDTIGFIAGNHDRSSWTDLHNAAWPVVTDWLRADQSRALAALDIARSTRHFAGGIDEIWPLANEGRVETIVVEEGYALAVRVVEGLLDRAADREAPDVVDDIVDDTIEAVLRCGGSAVIVADGVLSDHERIAAVLRF